MPAKNKLTDALEQSEKASQAEVPTNETETENEKQYLPPSRQGKKQIAGYFSKEVHYQIKLISLETGKSIQALLAESLNHLFHQYDKPPIA